MRRLALSAALGVALGAPGCDATSSQRGHTAGAPGVAAPSQREPSAQPHPLTFPHGIPSAELAAPSAPSHPAAASSAEAPAPLGLRLGDPRERAIAALGPCHPGGSRCFYPARGVELGLSHGRVERLVLHAAGERPVLDDDNVGAQRALAPPDSSSPPGAAAVSAGYPEDVLGLTLQATAPEVLRVLGEPSARLTPLGRDRAERELWEYPSRGFALELAPQSDGPLRLVRVHIPLAPARPRAE